MIHQMGDSGHLTLILRLRNMFSLGGGSFLFRIIPATEKTCFLSQRAQQGATEMMQFFRTKSLEITEAIIIKSLQGSLFGRLVGTMGKVKELANSFGRGGGQDTRGAIPPKILWKLCFLRFHPTFRAF